MVGVKSIDNAVFELWKQIYDLKFVNPVNQSVERERFFGSRSYNPQFVYCAQEFDVGKVKARLGKLSGSLGRDAASLLLSRKIRKLCAWCDMLRTVGTDKFSVYAQQYYGVPDISLLRRAKHILNQRSSGNRERTVTAEQMVVELEKKIEELGIDWTVRLEDHLGAAVDCVTSKNTLLVKTGATFSERDITRLAVHELGVHAQRSINSRKLPYKLFVMGTAEYETTEEGLAVWNEARHGVLAASNLRKYAGRVLVVGYALRHSFRETYMFARQWFAVDDAYALCVRVKRGLSDTSKAGAFTKDLIYLKGYELVRQVKDVDALFVGRISVGDVPIVKKMLHK